MGGEVADRLLLLLFLALLVASPLPAAGNEEVRVLMEVKASLDPEGRFLSSWTVEGDPCRGGFEGVACNEHGKVANISLQSKGLSGTISPAVGGLRCLSGLFLHYNALTGEIPPEIANLTELSDLYLNVNNLSGGIPPEIGNMASLQVLQLCCNQLTGSIPNQLGLLKKLSFLALQSNRLTGAIPASLGDLTELRRLDLSFNHLFGSIPSKLAQVPRLAVLDVRNNTLSGNVPYGIEYLHSIKDNSKPSLVHQNLSADKILIDHHFKPLISGSGLHKLLADDVVFSTLKSSAAMGYLAPEYTTTGRFTEKSDVYAFGVVLLQILSGKRQTNPIRLNAEAGKLEDLIDENLQGNFSKAEAAKLAGIALVCTSEVPTQRPAMVSVLQELCGNS